MDSSTSLAPSPEMVKRLGLGHAARVRRIAWQIVKGGILVGIVALVALAIQRARRPAPPPEYVTEAVSRGDLRVTVSATGRVEASTTVEVGAEVSGRVTKVTVDVNDLVKRGQVLAEIDPEQLQASVGQEKAQLASARAAVRQARATLVEAKQSAARTESLAKQQLESTQNVEAAQASVARAEAAVDSAVANAHLAEAGLRSASSKLDKTTIRSPIDGVVLSRLFEPGQTVTAGFSTPLLFKLAEDLKRMTLKVDVDEADIGRVREGDPAMFAVDAYTGRQFPSRVVRLSNEPSISQNVVTYQAVLEVDNQELLLRPGMTATATITTEVRTDVVLVPNAALRFNPPGVDVATLPAGSGRVWVESAADANGRRPAPTEIEVRTGATDGLYTEIVGASVEVGAAVLIDTKDPS